MTGIGQILVEKKIITQAQLERALNAQRQKPGKYLGQILVEMGISQLKIIKALYYSNKRKMLGQVLIDLNIISPDQLNRAIAEQKRLQTQFGVRKPIGSFLVELGFINMNDYLNALSIHFNMPIISLEAFKISPSLQKAFGEKYTYHHKIVVLQNSPDLVKIALPEPNLFILEELEKALPAGKGIFFFLARTSEIEACFQKTYDPFQSSRYR